MKGEKHEQSKQAKPAKPKDGGAYKECPICGALKRSEPNPEAIREGKNHWAYFNEDGSRHRCRDQMLWVKLDLPYEQKDEAKQVALGAPLAWDAKERFWWTRWRPGVTEDFRPWNPRTYYGDKRVDVKDVVEVAG